MLTIRILKALEKQHYLVFIFGVHIQYRVFLSNLQAVRDLWATDQNVLKIEEQEKVRAQDLNGEMWFVAKK